MNENLRVKNKNDGDVSVFAFFFGKEALSNTNMNST